MFKDFAFRISVILKVVQIILFKIALTEGVGYTFYPKQRMASFIIFTLLIITAGRDNKYFSFLIALLGAIIFNPFYSTEFNGNGFDLIEWVFIAVIMLWIFTDYYYRYRIMPKGKAILRALRMDKKTKMYRVADASVVYEIDPSIIMNLKEYLKKSNIGTIGSWYYKLAPEDKNKVKRASKYGMVFND
ncbi:hypothetical protein LK994_12195 [Ferruginibacter lapsinanis]|uniref:DUF6804 family protein n=1 Tax=Ferruginibacter lapsinanis TaxID=563172 RepID=UPI001E2E27D5|nr:DUF6804 family protein [Ferruginibacter lapsinanis]UEG49393.1 hypothetical protein LK994_12195 [Ferruginibacter lapsinanis]